MSLFLAIGLGGLGLRLGRLGLLGSASGSPAGPDAPVAAMDPAWDTTQAIPLYILDAAWADQDDLQYEVKDALADWSSATISNHTVTVSEINGTLIDFPGGALSNGDKVARFKFKHSGGVYSNYSDEIPFTIAAVTNRLMWGTDQLLWGTDNLTWS